MSREEEELKEQTQLLIIVSGHSSKVGHFGPKVFANCLQAAQVLSAVERDLLIKTFCIIATIVLLLIKQLTLGRKESHTTAEDKIEAKESGQTRKGERRRD